MFTLEGFEGFKLIKQGAEARLYCGIYLDKQVVIKERFVKKYRQPQLDKTLTTNRIKSEVKMIARCRSAGILTPSLYLADQDRRIIIMEYLSHSITVKDFIFRTNDEKILNRLAEDIGTILGKMHKNNVIHGDLTTSNILLVKKVSTYDFDDYDNLKIYLIDFGLAYREDGFEDKGVDLYVLERALISTHSEAQQLFPIMLEAYKKENAKESEKVMSKFEEVRARGRKRTMVG